MDSVELIDIQETMRQWAEYIALLSEMLERIPAIPIW
jgi:hypothetical protein